VSDLFIIGASGTRAYRTAMAAISENITNSSTEGYARRTVTTSESGASTATMALYVSRATFGGVEVRSVNRASDPYLDATMRMTNMTMGSATARLRWQTDTENALNDSDTGVGKRITGLFGNIDKLAASPNDKSLRVTTLDSVGRIAESFRQTDADLKNVSAGIATEATDAVSRFNKTMQNLADINNSLLRAQPGTSAYAQLLDSRDSAMQTLATTLNVDISFGANETAQVSYAGQTLLQGNVPTPVTLTTNADGTLALGTAAGALATPANGQLGGLFAAATTATARRADLDALAEQFTADINAWHAQGRTDTNQPGGALLSGTTAATIAALITDPAELATRSADGALNGNLLNTASLRGSGSVEQGWTAMIATHANLLGATKQDYTTAQARDDQAVAAREAVSGVDLDMEAADLLRIQQAYSGSAKILQIARETVDAILQII
jgi:flagellar hook-associated protein 1 FlgK